MTYVVLVFELDRGPLLYDDDMWRKRKVRLIDSDMLRGRGKSFARYSIDVHRDAFR
jgi:hypothetical protein